MNRSWAWTAAGLVLWLGANALVLRLWLGACCGFDVFSAGHYAFVWQAFLAGARFHQPSHWAFLLTWPVMAVWGWLTLRTVPVPFALGSLLAIGAGRLRSRGSGTASAKTVPTDLSATAGNPTAPTAALGPALPAMPPLQATQAKEAPAEPPTPPVAAPIAGTSAIASSMAAPQERAHRPVGLHEPLSLEELRGLLNHISDPGEKEALNRAIEAAAPAAPAMLASALGAEMLAEEHDRVVGSLGARSPLSSDADPDAARVVVERFEDTGMAAWAIETGDSPAVVALGGTVLWVAAVWNLPGEWRDDGPEWTNGERRIPSPVLGVNRVADALSEALEQALPQLPFSVEAMVVIGAPADLRYDARAGSRWAADRVMVCAHVEGGDLPSVAEMVRRHPPDPPDQAMRAFLDREFAASAS